ncbi:TerB family tellurite resistance protein [Methylobrevis pamukkalensis]|uniref:DnaJ-like protein DjlA n=1 Tax=Methylobrevis pamukkalensis TaxID=1439726 RepID=A0A1E3GRK7_9HYPH|nr:TerB family tellurite resistance protein [Methylobrevis pamukkalensis]ODN66216.1 DnaJ-like protein DjlA [Methylobrevis pamukkalensis]
MTLWSRLSELLDRLHVTDYVGAMIDHVVALVRETFGGEARRQVAFTVSMIALAAKMAKADGVVSDKEVDVFRRIFVVPDDEKRNVARLFNLARQDVAGYDIYASRIERLHSGDLVILEDILDGLFMIAGADGQVHEREILFLEHVAAIFRIRAHAFDRILSRHVHSDGGDPYVVLGIPRGTHPAEVKRHYRKLVMEMHPDKLIARGVPAECVRLATERLASLNGAYERIEKEFAV